MPNFLKLHGFQWVKSFVSVFYSWMKGEKFFKAHLMARASISQGVQFNCVYESFALKTLKLLWFYLFVWT